MTGTSGRCKEVEDFFRETIKVRYISEDYDTVKNLLDLMGCTAPPGKSITFGRNRSSASEQPQDLKELAAFWG